MNKGILAISTILVQKCSWSGRLFCFRLFTPRLYLVQFGGTQPKLMNRTIHRAVQFSWWMVNVYNKLWKITSSFMGHEKFVGHGCNSYVALPEGNDRIHGVNLNQPQISSPHHAKTSTKVFIPAWRAMPRVPRACGHLMEILCKHLCTIMYRL